ncbi:MULTISPECIES: hypothetical protein [Calothrix]|uniref:Uncharacterized protein n=2 Tax=Calothrix TaxID=1186 RepID=A0ABR8A925_9CYAN|nr:MULTISPECIES: hypothetical protein [Calothrix]MBD2195788.1 hypothetical protein [Calothrix parietina FACHB-288]MBD2224444.1 hypothetical protein [Calothrix anomala FACHB-343]
MPKELQSLNISRDKWLRISRNGAESFSMKSGQEAQESIFLAVSESLLCAMGFYGHEIKGIPIEKLIDVKYLSDIGVDDLLIDVASDKGDIIPLEREISRINERRASYANYTDDQVEARLAGLFSLLGVRLVFS